jgi:hypothetical protein
MSLALQRTEDLCENVKRERESNFQVFTFIVSRFTIDDKSSERTSE